MAYIRLSDVERDALNRALSGFEGEVYVFGSRLDADKRGGDIDILLKPVRKTDIYSLRNRIALCFERELQQSLDVVVFDDQSLFCREIVRHAKPFDIARV